MAVQLCLNLGTCPPGYGGDCSGRITVVGHRVGKSQCLEPPRCALTKLSSLKL